MTSKADPLEQAHLFLQQGNFTQALRCYRAIQPENSEIKEKINWCLNLLLRKYWRQNRPEEFAKTAKEMGCFQILRLCHARLQGKDSLELIAKEAEGTDGLLARCSLEPDLKTALLSLRQQPQFKELAEGWLILIKGDADKAATLFKQAQTNTPVQAHIGQGVYCLLKNELNTANALLSPLRPFANQRFPRLNEAMQWNAPDAINEQIVRHYLFRATPGELKQAAQNLPPHQRELGGWIYLRLGDCIYAEGKYPQQSHDYHTMCETWKKAAHFYPALELDVLRRQFLASLYPDCPQSTEKLFSQLYRKLAEQKPEQAKEFIDFLLHDLTHKPHQWLSEEILRPKNNWLINPPPPELQFLWLYLAYSDQIQEIADSLAFDVDSAEELTAYSWDHWRTVFQQLDPFYRKDSLYLQIKQDIAEIFQQFETLRQTIVERLQLNPVNKEELLPKFVRSVQLDRKKIPYAMDQKRLQMEIDHLLRLYPNDYDLIRIKVLTAKNLSVWEQNPDFVNADLSPSLRGVLRLQMAIDHGWAPAKCRKMIPENHPFGSNWEADWRLFAALCTPKLKISVKELEVLIQKIAPENQKKHTLFSNLYFYYNSSPPYSLIKGWNGAGSSWHSFYHLALHHATKEAWPTMLQRLTYVESRISSEQPERRKIVRTLKHFFACEPGFTDLEDLFPSEIVRQLEQLFKT